MAEVTASATGRAFARSVSAIYGYCASTTLSDACVWASGSIEAVAEAEAQALAMATVDFINCNCMIETSAVAESFKEVMVSTLSSVQADLCIHGALSQP